MQSQSGGVAEWSMAAVLKTVERQRSGGSNPSASAQEAAQTRCFFSLRRRDWRFAPPDRSPCTPRGRGKGFPRLASRAPFCRPSASESSELPRGNQRRTNGEGLIPGPTPFPGKTALAIVKAGICGEGLTPIMKPSPEKGFRPEGSENLKIDEITCRKP